MFRLVNNLFFLIFSFKLPLFVNEDYSKKVHIYQCLWYYGAKENVKKMLKKYENLLNLDATIAKELFGEVNYPWEVLPLINV